MPSSLWHCLRQGDGISQNVLLPQVFHGEKHLSMPKSCHPKNGLFVFCPYWCLLSRPHYSVVLLNLTKPFHSILKYRENLTFFPILHTDTVHSFSTGFCRELNYKSETDGENNIYILASSKFFLPAIHPSCCPSWKEFTAWILIGSVSDIWNLSLPGRSNFITEKTAELLGFSAT